MQRQWYVDMLLFAVCLHACAGMREKLEGSVLRPPQSPFCDLFDRPNEEIV